MANIPELKIDLPKIEISAEVPPPIPEPDKTIVSNVQATKAEFMTDCVRLDLGGGFTKLVDYASFFATFSKFMETKEKVTKEQGLLLPSNVIWLSQTATHVKVVCYYPEGVKKVNFCGTSVPRITPNVIVCHQLEVTKTGHKVIDTRYLSTNIPLQSLDRKFFTGPSHANNIYILPFSNMYDSGAMCTGANQLPKQFEKGDLRGLHHYHEMIFNSPFNHDLSVKAISSNNRYYQPTEWFAYLAKIAKDPNPKFPYSELLGYRPAPGEVVQKPTEIDPIIVTTTIDATNMAATAVNAL